jgi:hypothetical protein
LNRVTGAPSVTSSSAIGSPDGTASATPRTMSSVEPAIGTKPSSTIVPAVH